MKLVAVHFLNLYMMSIFTYVTVLRKRGLLVGFAEFAFLVSLERASNALYNGANSVLIASSIPT